MAGRRGQYVSEKDAAPVEFPGVGSQAARAPRAEPSRTADPHPEAGQRARLGDSSSPEARPQVRCGTGFTGPPSRGLKLAPAFPGETWGAGQVEGRTVAEVLDKFGGSLGTSAAPGRMMSTDEAWRTTLFIRGRRARPGPGPHPVGAPVCEGVRRAVQCGDRSPTRDHHDGRVEHLQTGRRSRFTSADELLAWIMAMLTGTDRSDDAR